MSRGSKGGGGEEYASKGAEESAVDACPGWREACDFCEKRFGPFLDLDEDLPDKIPDKPGYLQVALKSKGGVTEVVDVAMDAASLQRVASARLDKVKERVADKKSKFTKAQVVCRWMPFKLTKDKEVSSVAAHWLNLGVLPKFVERFDDDILQVLPANGHYTFSERLQKWCHNRQDAYWKKSKSAPSKTVEVIEACDWSKGACEACDTTLGKWRPLDAVVRDDAAPDARGLYQAAVLCAPRQREVVYIGFDPHHVSLNVRSSIASSAKWLSSVLHNKKFEHKNPSLQVRWCELSEVESEKACVLFAHWLNTQSLPLLNHLLPGESILDKNKRFVVRNHDQRWCYETDALRQNKTTKSKTRKQMMDELTQDLDDMEAA